MTIILQTKLQVRVSCIESACNSHPYQAIMSLINHSSVFHFLCCREKFTLAHPHIRNSCCVLLSLVVVADISLLVYIQIDDTYLEKEANMLASSCLLYVFYVVIHSFSKPYLKDIAYFMNKSTSESDKLSLLSRGIISECSICFSSSQPILHSLHSGTVGEINIFSSYCHQHAVRT